MPQSNAIQFQVVVGVAPLQFKKGDVGVAHFFLF